MDKTGVTLARHDQQGATLTKVGLGRVSHLVESCNCGLSRDPSLAVSLRSVSSGWGRSPVWSCA